MIWSSKSFIILGILMKYGKMHFSIACYNSTMPKEGKFKFAINKSLILIAMLFFLSCNNSPTNKVEKKGIKAIDAFERSTNNEQKLYYKKLDSSYVKAELIIRRFIENKEPNENYYIEGEKLYSYISLPQFYVEGKFHPAWFLKNDFSKAFEMLEFINNLIFHGLPPKNYHQKIIEQNLNDLKKDSSLILNPYFLANTDILLSDAFFIIAFHLYHGKVDAGSFKAQWDIQRGNKKSALVDELYRLQESGSINSFFIPYYPPHPGYLFMVKEAERLHALKDEDFEILISDKNLPLKPGDQSNVVPKIRKKLSLLDLYDNPLNDIDSSFIYDSLTVKSIKKLQTQHGLNPDGVLGKNTFNALNSPIKQLIQKIYVNLERLRWMPDSLEKTFIMINIADFSLDMISAKDTLITMKTVVGKNYRQTPVFNSLINYIVLSPTWTVPSGIMRNDLIPAVSKNVHYLSDKNMIVLDERGNKIDPNSIDWKNDGMRYTVRQLPGSQNSLGKVKFMFPNKYSVYLHDTPSKELFLKEDRSFSSGCIRIEKPYELTKLLLQDMPEWTEEKIKKAMNSSSESTVLLKSRVGVYLYYLTSWSNSNGLIMYRNDIYKRDQEIFDALML